MTAELSYEQVRAAGAVWVLGSDAGVPAVLVGGVPVMRFWSSAARAARVRRTDPACARLAVVRLELPVWSQRWLPGLEADGLLAVLDDLPPASPAGLRAALGLEPEG